MKTKEIIKRVVLTGIIGATTYFSSSSINYVQIITGFSIGVNIIQGVLGAMFGWFVLEISNKATKIEEKLNEVSENNIRHNLAVEEKLKSLMTEVNIQDITTAIFKKKESSIVRDAMLQMFEINSSKLAVNRWGNFTIHGEENSFEAYVILWEKLLDRQRMMKESSNFSKEDYLVARITHSTGPDKWDVSEGYLLTREALILQKKFIDCGGKIIRFFVCPEKYEEKSRMKAIIEEHRNTFGIPSYYVEAKHELLKSDYLYFRKEKVVCKWHSGANGRGLVRMEVIDDISVIDDTDTSWLHLWYKCVECYEENGFLDKEEAKKSMNDAIPSIMYQYDFGEPDFKKSRQRNNKLPHLIQQIKSFYEKR